MSSNFTYDKYKEMINKIEKQLETLKTKNESNYISFATEDAARSLISIGNSINCYIRHSGR